MKKIFTLMWAIVCAALTVVSCTTDGPAENEPETPPTPEITSVITVSGAPEANLAPEAGEFTLNYAIENATLTGALSVTTEAAWLKPGEVGLDAVPFTYEANSDAPGSPAREAVIKFAYEGAEDVLVTVKQDSATSTFTVTFDEATLTCGHASYTWATENTEIAYVVLSTQDLGQFGIVGNTPKELLTNYISTLAGYGMLSEETLGYYWYKGAPVEGMYKEASRYDASESVQVYAVGFSAEDTGEIDPTWESPIYKINLLTPVHVWDVPFLPYPTVNVAEADLNKTVTSAAGSVVIDCVVENPIEGTEMLLETEATWVTPTWADGKLTLAYEANTAAVARRAKIAVSYGNYTNPFEITLVQEKDANAQAITLNIEVVGTQFNGIIVNVTPSDETVTYALNQTAPEKDWETGAELEMDWMGIAEELLSYTGNATFHKGALTNHFIKMNPSHYEFYGYDYYVYAVPVAATSEGDNWTVSQILGEVAYTKTTIDASKMPSLEWDLTKNPELVENKTNDRYDLEVVEGSTVVLHFNVINPVEGAFVTLNGTSLYDSYNVVDGEPVVDNAAGTITFKIDKFDTAKSYHYVQPTFKYTNADGDTWGITTPVLRLTQVAAPAPAGPAIITKVADLKAGEYYVAGKLAEYNNNGTMKYWTDYPYHFWTGAVSAPGSTSSNSDLLTVNGNEAMVLDPNMAEQDAKKGNPGVITLVAVEGKTNTYYVKVGEQYLYSCQSGTNRRMQLGDTPTEWVFADHSKGGIDLTSNGVHLATAGATYNMIRSYKDSSAGSSHQHGLVFFTK